MGRPTQTIGVSAIVVALGMSLLAGCSGSRETEKPSTAVEETLKKYEAGFKPSDYDPEPKGKSGHSGTSADSIPDSGATLVEAPTSMELVAGFRVQLFSTTNIDEANLKKADAEATFPDEWVYVEYDPPTYKVRAGNFKSRIAADRFANLASSNGFQEAWTVPERVYKQPPPPPRLPASPVEPK
jgi:hypothetical protein